MKQHTFLHCYSVWCLLYKADYIKPILKVFKFQVSTPLSGVVRKISIKFCKIAIDIDLDEICIISLEIRKLFVIRNLKILSWNSKMLILKVVYCYLQFVFFIW